MKTQIEKAEAFRALHARPRDFIIPNPWDVGTARMLAKIGFEALATTSAGYAFSAGVQDNRVGRAKMLAWLTQNTANVEVVFYSAGTPSITLENDTRAQSRASMTEGLFIKATGERRLLLGTYRDELEKVDGVWRFKKREVSIDHAEVPGGVVRPLVDPTPVYPWSIAWRRGLRRDVVTAIVAAVEALTAGTDWLELPAGAWLPEPEASRITRH